RDFRSFRTTSDDEGKITLNFTNIPILNFYRRSVSYYTLSLYDATHHLLKLTDLKEQDNQATLLYLYHASFPAEAVYEAQLHFFLGCGQALNGDTTIKHNHLEGLQGGDVSLNEFLHLTNEQKTYWDGKEEAGTAQALIDQLKDGVPIAGNTLMKLYQLILNFNNLKVVASLEERDATNPAVYQLVIVQEAAADPLVDAGSAMYAYDELLGVWLLVLIFENVKVVLEWDNIVGKPRSFPPAPHTHSARDIIPNTAQQFVSQAEKNTWNAKQDTVTTASETKAGIIAIATSEETNAGVTDNKAITPAKLLGALNLLKGGVPAAGNTLAKLYTLITSTGQIARVVADIATRDNLDTTLVKLAIVKDASADETVEAGAALYAWEGEKWLKLSEYESMDIVLDWSEIQNKPTAFPPASHTHEASEITTTAEAQFVSQEEKEAWNTLDTASNGIVKVDSDFQLGGQLKKATQLQLNQYLFSIEAVVAKGFEEGDGFLGNTFPFTLRVLEDGKLLLAGNFVSYQNSNTERLVRLSAGGSVEAVFLNDLFTYMSDLVVLTNGQIVVVGRATSGARIYRLAAETVEGKLILANATEEPTEGNATEENSTEGASFGAGFQNTLLGPRAVVELPPNQLLVVTSSMSSTYQGTVTKGLFLLQEDGSLDEDFYSNLGEGFDAPVFAIVYDSERERIYALGNFTTFNGEAANGLICLQKDGTRETAFAVGEGLVSETFGDPRNQLLLQPDGKLLISAAISRYQGAAVSNTFRLQPDGSLDLDFQIPRAPICLTEEGKVLVGSTLFYADGRVDTRFEGDQRNIGNQLDDWNVYKVAYTPDRCFIYVGQFNLYKGQLVSGIVKVNQLGVLLKVDETAGIDFGSLATYQQKAHHLYTARTLVDQEYVLRATAGFEKEGVISFAEKGIYGSPSQPLTTRLNFDLSGAIRGIRCTIYHQTEIDPTDSFPAFCKRLSSSSGYIIGQLNILEFIYEDENHLYYRIEQVT
ncbi:MAG: hypothetical protein AAF734_00040, partial [Bacteroidota bacterium]